MIDYLIHLYQRGCEPFRSLSGLSDGEAVRIMQSLYREGSVYWERFEDAAGYLQMRRQTEHWLRREFIAKGGRLRDPHPIYLILGRTKWVKTALDAVTRATTEEIEVPLALFAACDISFTYPDSMVSFMLASQKDPACYLPEFHGKVFTLAEMSAIVDTCGLPGETWGANLPSHLANYIDAQVWNRQPLLDYWRELGSCCVYGNTSGL
jgi:hypothetical protein